MKSSRRVKGWKGRPALLEVEGESGAPREYSGPAELEWRGEPAPNRPEGILGAFGREHPDTMQAATGQAESTEV